MKLGGSRFRASSQDCCAVTIDRSCGSLEQAVQLRPINQVSKGAPFLKIGAPFLWNLVSGVRCPPAMVALALANGVYPVIVKIDRGPAVIS